MERAIKNKEEATIFGYTLDEIKQAQQSGSLARRLPPGVHKPLADGSDFALLEKYGEQKLRELGYYGVLGRLANSRLSMPDCDQEKI